MGLGGRFLKLMQGLIIGGLVKIHINEKFLEYIPLEMGVLHGCPLAPMLFAIYTQSLLTFLQAKRLHKRMQRVCLDASLYIYEWMFVDNLGIFILTIEHNFTKLEEIIMLYEQALRPKLNIHKSTVIPLGINTVRQWLHNKGCQILEQGDIIKYLGAPLGFNILSQKLHNFCLHRVCKCISSWQTKHISFAGWLILIRQVLHAIPTYHLMYKHFTKSQDAVLQWLYKDFLWGVTKTEMHKTPLISWERMEKPHQQGGFGICQIYWQGIALLARWASKLLENPNPKWSQFFFSNMTTTKWHHQRAFRRHGYSIQDKVIGKPKRFGKCSYPEGLWTEWAHLCQLLQFNITKAYLLAY